MTKWAKIIDGVVDTITLQEPTDGRWLEVADNVFPRFADNGDGTFSEPVKSAASTNPTDYRLNPAQFEAILTLLGITVEQIDVAIDQAISDATANAFAKAKVRKATSYNRDNELFGLLGPILNISDTDIDTAWLQAKDFR